MQTSSLIQILVFVLAALIVLVFLLSGIHFVRTIYHVQASQDRERRAQQIAAHIAERLREQNAVELKQRDGVLIEQPDGAHDVALCVEPADAEAAAAEESAGPSGGAAADGGAPEQEERGSVWGVPGRVWAAELPGSVWAREAPELPGERRGPMAGLRDFLAAMNSQGFRH